MLTLRPGQRILNIPGIGVQTSRRAVGAGNGLLNSLVAYWPLNEAGGANDALDLHTNGLTLTQTASPGSAAGKVYSGARTFSGSTQYFSRATESALQVGDISFGVAAWVFPTSLAANAAIWSKQKTDGTQTEYLLFYSQSANRWRFSAYRPTDTSVAINADTHGAVQINAWTFIAAWHDATADTVNISINGGVVDSTATGGALQSAGAGEVTLARRNRIDSVFPFPGRIGPVAFWKSAAGAGGVLTAAQRTALWNAGAGLTYSAFTT